MTTVVVYHLHAWRIYKQCTELWKLDTVGRCIINVREEDTSPYKDNNMLVPSESIPRSKRLEHVVIGTTPQVAVGGFSSDH